MSCQAVPAKWPIGSRIGGWCLSVFGVHRPRPVGFDSLSCALRTVKSADPSRFLHSSYPKPIWRTDGASSCHTPQRHGQHVSEEEDRDICSAAQLGKPGRGKRIRESAGPTTSVRLWDRWLRGHATVLICSSINCCQLPLMVRVFVERQLRRGRGHFGSVSNTQWCSGPPPTSLMRGKEIFITPNHVSKQWGSDLEGYGSPQHLVVD